MRTLTHLSLWRPGPLWPECDWTAPLPPYWDKINKEIRTGAARGLLANNHSSLLQSWFDNKASHCASQFTVRMSSVFWATADSDDSSCEEALKGKYTPKQQAILLIWNDKVNIKRIRCKWYESVTGWHFNIIMWLCIRKCFHIPLTLAFVRGWSHINMWWVMQMNPVKSFLWRTISTTTQPVLDYHHLVPLLLCTLTFVFTLSLSFIICKWNLNKGQ